MARRVAITGLGIISPLGLNLAENWKSLSEGRSAIGPLQSVVGPLQSADLSRLALKIQNGAEVRGFDAAKHFEGGRENYLDRFAQFSVVAAREALRDSGLALTPEQKQNGAIVCGSAVGGQASIEAGFVDLWVSGRGRVHPLSIPKTMANAGASHISMERASAARPIPYPQPARRPTTPSARRFAWCARAMPTWPSPAAARLRLRSAC